MSPLAKDIVVSLVALAFVPVVIIGMNVSHGIAKDEAYQKGVEVGMAKAYKSAKEQIEADPNYTRVVCKLWWFGMDHRERSVK
jgi:hypothetical protein